MLDIKNFEDITSQAEEIINALGHLFGVECKFTVCIRNPAVENAQAVISTDSLIAVSRLLDQEHQRRLLMADQTAT